MHNMFTDIDNIVDVLHSGGLIIYPTDTIWGIGCDATDESAIQKIYELKQRKAGKPFIVLVSDREMLQDYVSDIHPRVESLLYYHQQPLTIIYKNVINLPEIVRGQKGTVAIRIVQDAYCQEFIRNFGKPIVSTSVNISKDSAPQHFAEISFDLLDQVDYISAHRRTEKMQTKPSTIISYNSNGKINFLR